LRPFGVLRLKENPMDFLLRKTALVLPVVKLNGEFGIYGDVRPTVLDCGHVKFGSATHMVVADELTRCYKCADAAKEAARC
jgi:hypothetical protein